jgi:hypothetical protein
MTVDLSTCVPGQKCVSKDGEYFTYLTELGSNHRYDHLFLDQLGSERSFTNDGIYNIGFSSSKYDIVCILPMESTTSDKHPSVAWWESCPWITNRKPTALDSDIYGRVYIKSSEGKVLASNWSDVSAYENWIHLCGWQPPVLSNKEQALELLNKHEGGWCPTPKEWTIIRKGLTE